jgi:hypothetical protein
MSDVLLANEPFHLAMPDYWEKAGIAYPAKVSVLHSSFTHKGGF